MRRQQGAIRFICPEGRGWHLIGELAPERLNGAKMAKQGEAVVLPPLGVALVVLRDAAAGGRLSG